MACNFCLKEHDLDLMCLEEAEEIWMAAQVGANYPEERLPLAIIMLKNNLEEAING